MIGPTGPAGATGATGPEGPAGVTGQAATTLTSTGAVMLGILSGGPALVPGLFGQIVTTPNSVVVFSSSGGIYVDGAVGDHVRVTIRLIVDGNAQEAGAYDVERGHFSDTGRWSFSIALTLSPGVHTVGVDAMLSGIHPFSNPNAFPIAVVGGAATTTPNHGTLTAVVVKQ